MKKIIKYSTLLAIISFVFAGSAFAQDPVSKNELESVLGRFSNYRFGTVSIWRFKNDDRDRIRETLKEFEIAESGDAGISEEEIKDIDARIISKTEECVRGGQAAEACFEDIEMSFTDVKLPSWDRYTQLYESVRKRILDGGNKPVVKAAYLVTTRSTKEFRGSVIALIVSYTDDEIAVNLEGPNSRDIYVTEEMKLITMTDMAEPMLTNLLDLCERRLAQGNLINATLDAQGIGNINWFGQKNFGKISSLVKNEYDMSPEDIQRVKRISDIQPIDQFIKQNEIIASPDLISWKSYELPVYEDENGNAVIDSFYAVNNKLPKLGLELKYGIDEINFPSFWSERMTFSVLWENVKLGVILPTNGWSSMAESVFKADRRLTHGGFGVAAEMDFPIKIIPKSGLFHFGIGYVFGDAEESKYKNRVKDLDNFMTNFNDNDYLVRFNGQFHYTFSLSLDEDYMMRVGLGGTLYTVEKWYNELVVRPEEDKKIEYKKLLGETVGGISGKVEFMTKNITTPYGLTLQYFDEGVGINGWLQIPVIANTFAIRLEAKGYSKLFKNNPRAWENSSVFIPMARFIVNF